MVRRKNLRFRIGVLQGEMGACFFLCREIQIILLNCYLKQNYKFVIKLSIYIKVNNEITYQIIK